MVFVYPAIFHKTEEGKYEGVFPDLEGCEGKGDTLDDAIEDANAAFWLNAFIACSCKDFHEKEQKRHGESVYDGVFSRNNTPGSSQ